MTDSPDVQHVVHTILGDSHSPGGPAERLDAYATTKAELWLVILWQHPAQPLEHTGSLALALGEQYKTHGSHIFPDT